MKELVRVNELVRVDGTSRVKLGTQLVRVDGFIRVKEGTWMRE